MLKRTTREKLFNAIKRVGISEDGIDVDWMQKDIFETTARLMKAQDHIEETVNSPVTDSPKDVRKGTAAYWKIKYQNLKEATSPNEIDLKNVPGLLKIKTVKPKQDTEKQTGVTQGHGSLHGSEIIKRVKEIKQKKLEAEKKKTQQRNMVEKFIKYKNGCTCGLMQSCWTEAMQYLP